jgi:hypothetical protein
VKPPKSATALEQPWWLLPAGRIHPAWFFALGAVFFAFDYWVGPEGPFPALPLIPVALCAWYSGRWPALALAAAMESGHILLLATVWRSPGGFVVPAAMTVGRTAALMILTLWVARLEEHERALQQHVKRLEGLLPICSFCKKIRNDAGRWEQLERYITDRSSAQFSHSFCPDCVAEHYPETLDPRDPPHA